MQKGSIFIINNLLKYSILSQFLLNLYYICFYTNIQYWNMLDQLLANSFIVTTVNNKIYVISAFNNSFEMQ